MLKLRTHNIIFSSYFHILTDFAVNKLTVIVFSFLNEILLLSIKGLLDTVKNN